MKAVLLAGLIAVAASVPTVANTCVIPTAYTSNAETAACAGPAAGYVVDAVCLNVDGTIASTINLNAGNLAPFTGPAGVLGCRIAGQDAAFGTSLAAGTGLATCPALAAGSTVLTNGAIKAVRVQCADGFFALPGTFSGVLPCVSATDGTIFENALGAGVVGGFANVFGTANPLVLTGANRLQCVAGCTLPTSVCNNGNINGGLTILGDDDGDFFGPVNCVIPPGQTVRAFPSNSINVGTPATFACSTTGVLTTGGATLLVPLTGAIGCPWIGDQVEDTPRSFGAGTLDDFDAVTSTVTSTGTFPIVQGTARQQFISVVGCPVGVAGNGCVQDAVRYWRCRGFNVDSCTQCLNNGVRIACPTHDNGFGDCDNSSKKGLLGLLGLLGLIPLLCCSLLLCCLFPCCIRRRKTEGDVHFATFDPHAAPVAATVAPVPTAMAMPMAHCADPCAVPTACF